MPFYIATVYRASSATLAVEGYAGMTRRVVRLAAEDEGHFRAMIMDWSISDVDALVEFGPISLSKLQGDDK